MAKNWFITGGTPGGFGMAFAEAALEIGDRVTLTARRPTELSSWAATFGDRVLVVPLDVTDGDQVRTAVETAEEHFGGIDVLVNNAGRGWYGSVEGMRARGSGWIVNMSSVAGLRGVTGFGYYSATKFAVEGMTEVLRDEVAPFGIKVMAVEPGAFRTRAYAGFSDEPVRESVTEYRSMVEEVRDAMVAQDGAQPGDPRRGARAVIAAMGEEPPPHRLVLGADGFDAAVGTLESTLAELREYEALSRGADFPAG